VNWKNGEKLISLVFCKVDGSDSSCKRTVRKTSIFCRVNQTSMTMILPAAKLQWLSSGLLGRMMAIDFGGTVLLPDGQKEKGKSWR